MKKIGVHTFGFAWTCGLEQAVDQLLAHGIKSIQVMAIAPHLDHFTIDDATVQAIRSRVEAAGGRILAVDLPSSDINLASTNPRVVDFALESYLTILRLSAQLGGRYVTLNTGRRHLLLPAPEGMLEAIYEKALAVIAREAKALGLGVIIENIPGAVFSSADSLAALVDRCGFDNVSVLYDVANAVAIGEDPVAGLERLGQRATVVHLSDTPKGGWKHAPIGTGDVDFAAIAQKLAAMNYQGEIILEILSPNPIADVQDARAKLGKLGLQ